MNEDVPAAKNKDVGAPPRPEVKEPVATRGVPDISTAAEARAGRPGISSTSNLRKASVAEPIVISPSSTKIATAIKPEQPKTAPTIDKPDVKRPESPDKYTLKDKPDAVTIPDKEVANMVNEAEKDYQTSKDKPAIVKLQPATKSRKKSKNYGSKKMLLILAGLLGAVIVAALVYVFFIRSSSSTLPVAETTKVDTNAVQKITTDLSVGRLERSQDKGQSWRALAQEDEILEGEWLRAASEVGSKAVIKLEDGSELRLDADARIELTTVKGSEVDIKLRSGRVYARVAKKSTRSFVVSTQFLSAKATGTAYLVSSSISTDSVDVYEGRVSEEQSATNIKQGKSLTHDNNSKVTKESTLDIEVLKLDSFVIWNRSQDILNDSYAKSLGMLEDIVSPVLEVTSPANNASTTLAKDEKVSIKFVGTSEVNVTIRITSGAEDKEGSPEVTADVDGKFVYLLESQETVAAGEIKELDYTVAAIDKNGNKTIQVIRLVYTGEVVDSITLAAISQPGVGVILNWTLLPEGRTATEGIRMVWDVAGTPVYTEVTTAQACNLDSGALAVNTGSTSVACLIDGRTYNFRVCEFIGATNTCGLYSNELSITAPQGGSD